jgi:hypothetical protein
MSVKIARVTPSLPQWGRQPKGASPLDPHERLDFSFTLPKNDPLPCSTGRDPDKAVSARSPIATKEAPSIWSIFDISLKKESRE